MIGQAVADTVSNRALIFPLLGLLGLGGILAGCGPSVQVMHEASVRFEHCYRLDLDPEIAVSHRLACWREWRDVYSVEQTRDRREHAEDRIRKLEAGDATTQTLRVAPGPQDSASVQGLRVPTPSSAAAGAQPPERPPTAALPATPYEAPPATEPVAASPKVSPGIAARPAGSSHGIPVPAPPRSECSGRCESAWRSCRLPGTSEHRAPAGAAPPPSKEPSKARCDGDYSGCVRRCFAD